MIAATFHGTHYSPPNYDFDTIEVFPSLEQVIEALFDRYSANGQRHIDSAYLDGSTKSTFWPNVGVGDGFNCYLLTPEEGVTELNEDLVMEAHTAVHGGWKDYTVTLVESEQGSLLVTVERAGI